jgi:amino acid transporter
VTETPKGALGLKELVAMGIGGMIGGGIFSILGLAVDVAGHAAPLAFLSGSLIALAAGYSYAKLALAFRSDGASFTYLERAFPTRPEVAGIAGWTVVVGYIGTLALYAFTFGAYAGHLLGTPDHAATRALLSLGVLLLFMAINLMGAGTMGRAEDVVVYAKVVLLAVLGVAGFFTVDSSRFVPVFDRGISGALLGGALIFVAYEGFQLITNAVLETRDPDRNVPRGIYGSILITSAIYIAIAVVAVGTLDPAAIKAADEYALAVVARPILGKAGVLLVDLAALLATSSAINATLFGSARLASEMAAERFAPAVFSFRSRTDVPVAGVTVITILAAFFAGLGSLAVIAAFSSMTFLLVSIGVCVANLRLRRTTGSAALPIVAALGLMSVTVVLLAYYLAANDPMALAFTAAVYLSTTVAHVTFERLRRGSG